MRRTSDYRYWDFAAWEIFESDIILEVHHILTEPVCPTVTVSFELPERAGMGVISSAIGDTIEEAIKNALDKAEVILRKEIETRKSNGNPSNI